MMFRVYYNLAGAHVRCRFFSGPREGALGKCGDLTMRLEEFLEFMRDRRIDFRPESGAQVIAPPPNHCPSADRALELVHEALVADARRDPAWLLRRIPLDPAAQKLHHDLQGVILDAFDAGFKLAKAPEAPDPDWERERT